MLKRCAAITCLVVWGFVLLPACGKMQHEWTQMTGPQEQSRYYNFNDVQVPTSLRLLEDQSSVFKTGAVTAGVLTFEGRVESASLADYFQRSMPVDNWKLQGYIKYPQIGIFFAKPGKACLIQMKEGPVNTDVSIWVIPTEIAQ
ncbi:MAG: hypothetical protein KQJ78_01140 [Deltaproteobacteria bacterium]|nr:hypothetical protein [Deltaproteobacteria bacterium]